MGSECLNRIVCLIPAYKPSEEFVKFVEKLSKYGYRDIIVVDDGGGQAFYDTFEKAKEFGCVVVKHEVNKGKGRALKTGIEYFIDNYDDCIGIVTADADGQHGLSDIENVAISLCENSDSLIMGCRQFGEEVPFKSKAGNEITKVIYRLASGNKLSDTQTGLRGFPSHCLQKLLLVKGERYEFEMSMLMELKGLNLKMVEVPIKTIYIDGNSASHFNAVKDSILVYGMIFKYIGASILSFLVDYGIFALLLFLMPSILQDPERLVRGLPLAVIISNIGARICSTVLNFILNKNILTPVTSEKKNVGSLLLKYYALATFSLILDTLLVSFLSLIIGSYMAKILSAIVIYLFNFTIQKRYIFV